jgi:hypothetical protein
VEKRSLLEHFDFVSLALDEIIDRGIILETDAQQVITSLSRPPTSAFDMPLNEQTLSSAFSKIKSFLK